MTEKDDDFYEQALPEQDDTQDGESFLADYDESTVDHPFDGVSDDEKQQVAGSDGKDVEKEEYSQKVQKRINKITYERNIEREKRENAERRYSELAAKISALEEAQSNHLSSIEKNKADQEKAELLSKRRDMLEIGDYDVVNEIDEKLIEIKLRERSAEPPKTRPQQGTYQQNQEQAQVPKAMADWYEKNQWVYDPGQKARLDMADKIYNDLLSKGYDPKDHDTYREIDRVLMQRRERAPTGGGPDRGSVIGSHKPTFTADDKKSMEMWGLDPNDVEHRKEWMKNKGAA